MLTVSVPATTANLGPGFDVLGMALELRNAFRFVPAPEWSADGRPIDPGDHLVLHTARLAAAHFGGTLAPLALTTDERVPRSRGLGSSATARVAGVAAALHFTGIAVPLDDRLALLAELEGHPDNVVPAQVGGLTLCGAGPTGLAHLRLDPPPLRVALCVPEREVPTDAARRILPDRVARADAVDNVSAVAFLVAGLVRSDPRAIALGLRDRLHQPWRMPLIGPVEAAFDAARAAGALGAFVSGSGSTLAALCPIDADALAIARAMAAPFHAEGIGADATAVRPAGDGATIDAGS